MQITLVRGDITERAADAIVNAANTWLTPGGGVDGAIHRAGGPTILEACQKVITERFPGGLTTGQAVATTAGKLPARWVIHAVGPIYSKLVDRSDQLIATYRAALRVADELKATSVSFPAISTGAYAYPVDEAARLAVEAVRYARTAVQEAQFVVIDERAFQAFANVLMTPQPAGAPAEAGGHIGRPIR